MTNFRKKPWFAILALSLAALPGWAQGGHLGLAREQSGSLDAFYITADQHAHGIAYNDGAIPVERDYTASLLGTMPIANGGPLVSRFEQDSLYSFVATHYFTSDQHVHAIAIFQTGTVYDVDDTVDIGSTPLALAGSAIVSVVDNINRQMQTYYIANDGHLHMLGTPPTFPPSVRDLDLQTLAGGPNPAIGTSLAGAADMMNKQVTVFYLDAANHIQTLAYDSLGNYWNDDATALALAPPAATGSPLVSMQVDSLTETIYLGADQHVYSLFYSPIIGWSYRDLTKASGGALAAMGSSLASVYDSVNRVQEILFTDSAQHVHKLLGDARARWQEIDLGAIAASGSSLAATFDTVSNIPRALYVGSDLHVHLLSFLSPGTFSDADLTSLAGGPNAIP